MAKNQSSIIVVLQHNGVFWVESEVDVFTLIVVTLPSFSAAIISPAVLLTKI